jgi:hypothetical protein
MPAQNGHGPHRPSTAVAVVDVPSRFSSGSLASQSILTPRLSSSFPSELLASSRNDIDSQHDDPFTQNPKTVAFMPSPPRISSRTWTMTAFPSRPPRSLRRLPPNRSESPRRDVQPSDVPRSSPHSSHSTSDAPTPRPIPARGSGAPALGASVTPSQPARSQKVQRRQSAQRRLDALKGLVTDLDFEQPWGTSHEVAPRERTPSIDGRLAPHSLGRAMHDWHQSAGAASARDTDGSHHEGTLPPVGRASTLPVGNRRPVQRASLQSVLSAPSLTPADGLRDCVVGIPTFGFSRSLEPASPDVAPTAWRNAVSSDVRNWLDSTDSGESRRQEVIWEVLETEKAFLHSVRMVQRLLAAPLKSPAGGWIAGIPQGYCDLFDHLEKISLTHLDLDSISQTSVAQIIDVAEFALSMRRWASRLHVHERYLVHFQGVVAKVEEAVRDGESFFGEFFRMQTNTAVMGGMTLSSMLLKPVQRLMKYPLFLKVSADRGTTLTEASARLDAGITPCT